MKTIFLHCGLHKTGTTSLQEFLKREEEKFQDMGFLYPRTGRLDPLSGGHHNIAWLLCRDRRFQTRLGTIDELAAELHDFDADVVLSSEDFETALSDLSWFDPLLTHPGLRDWHFHFVIYFRDQASYFESLFIENLSAGQGEECRFVIDQLLSARSLRIRDWTFQFDYLDVITRFDDLPRISLTCRDYSALRDRSVIEDFHAVIGCRTDDPIHVARATHNRRIAPGHALALFLCNRLARKLTRAETEALDLLEQATASMRVGLSPATRLRLHDLFGGNAAFCTRCGFDPAAWDLRPIAARDGPALDIARVFSFETQIMVDGLARAIARPDRGADHPGSHAPALQIRAMIEAVVSFWTVANA